jgi:hypothetical protein
VRVQLGDNCIVFENFTASIGDLMVANKFEFTGDAIAESISGFFWGCESDTPSSESSTGVSQIHPRLNPQLV